MEEKPKKKAPAKKAAAEKKEKPASKKVAKAVSLTPDLQSASHAYKPLYRQAEDVDMEDGTKERAGEETNGKKRKVISFLCWGSESSPDLCDSVHPLLSHLLSPLPREPSRLQRRRRVISPLRRWLRWRSSRLRVQPSSSLKRNQHWTMAVFFFIPHLLLSLLP